MPTVLAIAGLGLSAFGAVTQMNAASQAASYQQQIFAEQQKQDAIRQNQMEVEGRRRQMEMVRNQQRVNAMSLTTATGQGAALGSGLQGAYGQASGQTGFNYTGVSDAMSFGNAMFNSNAAISQSQIGLAGAQSMSAFGSGLSSLGGSLMNSTSIARSMWGGPYGSTGYNYGQQGNYQSYPQYNYWMQNPYGKY